MSQVRNLESKMLQRSCAAVSIFVDHGSPDPWSALHKKAPGDLPRPWGFSFDEHAPSSLRRMTIATQLVLAVATDICIGCD